MNKNEVMREVYYLVKNVSEEIDVKKIMSLSMVFILILSVIFPISLHAQENVLVAENTETTDKTVETLEVFNSDELKKAFSNGEGIYTISLQNDITVEENTYDLKVQKNHEITLLGNGHTIYFQNEYGSITTTGGTLNLGNKDGEDGNTLTLDATGKSRREPMISIVGGTVNVYEGVTIKGVNNSLTKSTLGGGVGISTASFTEYGDSTFNMYGGVITECTNGRGTGGGVSVTGSSDSNVPKVTFNMYGGSIINNEAITDIEGNDMYGGGGISVLYSNATFNMYGGLIEGNKAIHRGGGIYNCLGTVTIKGGTIQNNTCDSVIGKKYGSGGGIYSYYGTTSIDDAVIESNSAIYGGGIYAYAINYSTKYPGQMIISKSKIQNNIASNGGGVYASYSKDVKLSDCALNGNGAHYGGGILTSNSTIAFGNSEVSNNQAYIGGGGLYVSSASTISCGSKGNVICNNTAGDNAADVYLTGNSKITLTNAKDMNETYLADEKGYMIDGWYQDSKDLRYIPNADSEGVDVTDELTGTQNLIASYKAPLTVTFDLQGGTWTDTNDIYAEKDGNYIENVYKGEKAHRPTEPTKSEYKFLGWVTKDSGAYDFSANVTKNVTLYANWAMIWKPLNAVPVISAGDRTLTVGDTFNPLDGVTASDREDGDITKDVEVLSSDVDTTKAGAYTVTYKVTDSKGASNTKRIIVTIRAKGIQKPTIDDNKEPTNTTDKQVTDNSLKTGDSTNITTWLAVMFVSFGLLVKYNYILCKRELKRCRKVK